MREFWRYSRGLARVMMALAATSVVCFVTPLPAAASMTGVGSFPLLALSMQEFPCTPGGCNATAEGTAALSLSGLGTATITTSPLPVPMPYSAVWLPTLSTLTAAFTYQDTCQIPGAISTTGVGNGTFVLSGGTVTLGGGALTAATLSGAITINRFANVVQIILSNLQITPPAGSPVIAVNLTTAIVGQSATAMVFTNGPGTCPTGQVMNQTAIVSGVALQPA